MVVGITRVRDEVDIVRYSLERMLKQVDHIIVGENFSQDGTREELEKLVSEGHPITLHDDSAKNFEQRDVMYAYAQEARQMGASWVVPFDMDELWTASEGTIAEALSSLPDEILLAPTRLLQYTCTNRDPDDPDPFVRMGYREAEMLPLPKVACRALENLVIGHGNHSATFTGVKHPPAALGVLQARHYPYRSPDQFVKRVRIAYPMLKDSGLPKSHGAHMWAYGEHWEEFGDEGLRRWFANGMVQDPDKANLVYDPAP